MKDNSFIHLTSLKASKSYADFGTRTSIYHKKSGSNVLKVKRSFPNLKLKADDFLKPEFPSINKSSMNLSQPFLSPINLHYKSPVLKNKQSLVEILQVLEKDSKSPNIKKAKAAYLALDLCASESGNYQKEMQMISQEIFKSLFVDKRELPNEIIDKVYDKDLDTLIDTEIPYFYVVSGYKEMLKDSKKIISRLQQDIYQIERGK